MTRLINQLGLNPPSLFGSRHSQGFVPLTRDPLPACGPRGAARRINDDTHHTRNPMQNLIGKITGWAMDRQLLGKTQDRKLAQLGKTTEELGELAAAILRGERDLAVDAIGDCTVCLVILAAQHDTTLEDCLETAYQQIKHRTGVTLSGVFVRDDE